MNQARAGRATVWVFGDQLSRRIGALAEADPARTTVLLVESTEQLAAHRYHRQRLQLVLAGMRRFATELAAEGFRVDHRRAPTLLDGLDQHRAEHRLPLAAPAARPADGRRPAGGWALEFDAENRLPPPRDGRRWAAPLVDDLDRAVLADLPPSAFGADPCGLWATDRARALRRLAHVVDEVLPGFGPYEDAMLLAAERPAEEPAAGRLAAAVTAGDRHTWRMAHSGLSHALNVGLLLPGEVCEAVERAYREGRVPLASAEGFLRQVIGWREYDWGVYWLWMPGYRRLNELGADRPLPPLFRHGPGATRMRCVAEALDGVEQRGWVHHIQRARQVLALLDSGEL